MATVRTRNLMLSSSILLLLTLVVGLIVVSARRAQELARQQMEFVAAVSHELRTPVSVIGVAAGNLADGVVEDPQRVRKYGADHSGRGAAAGRDGRARAAAGRHRRRPGGGGADDGASGRARDAVDSPPASRRSTRPGTTVETDIQDDLPLVQGDVAALRSAIQNLISNAVKYGGDARWLRVSVSAGAPSRLPAAGSRMPSPTSVAFTVEDRGLGIADEDRGHIFEPFYRGHEAVSRQIHGSGLGLNLVKRIAEAHGGTVTVASEAGQGEHVHADAAGRRRSRRRSSSLRTPKPVP